MDFREEYKKSAEVMTPSAEAMERMTKNIMEQINAPAKKAIPFKKISYIGGAVAACAVITVGAVKLLPSMQTELATADAAANESVTAVYQDSAAEEEYAPLNGVTADKDSASDIITDFAMDAAEDAVAESESIFDYAADAGDDTTAVAAPTVSANDGSSLFEDKSIADNADIFVAEEGVMEEAVCENAETIEIDLGFETGEVSVPVDSEITDRSDEMIYFSEDRQIVTYDGEDYYLLSPEYYSNLNYDCDAATYLYTGSDNKNYELVDWGEFISLSIIVSETHMDDGGVYSSAEKYDEHRKPCHTVRGDTSEAHAYEVFMSDEEYSFELSDDTYVLLIDGIRFEYISEGIPLQNAPRTKYLTAADGTVYQLDFYQDDYLVLLTNGEMLGSYARIKE